VNQSEFSTKPCIVEERSINNFIKKLVTLKTNQFRLRTQMGRKINMQFNIKRIIFSNVIANDMCLETGVA
jgi:hypothetical protein